MRVFLIILRVLVLLTALVGVGTAGGCGYTGYSSSQEKVAEKARKRQAALRVVTRTNPFYPSNLTATNAAVDSFGALERDYPILLASALLGLLGGIFAVMGYTNSGGLLLLVTGAAPAIISPWWAVFTSPLIGAGCGSLFVSFLAFVTRPKDGEGAEAEEEEKPKTRPKAAPKARVEEEEADALDEVEDVEEVHGLDAVEEVEEPPAKKPASKRPAVEDEEEEPPARPASKRKFKAEEDEEAPPPKRGSKRK